MDAGTSIPFTFDSKIIDTALRRIQSKQLNPRKEIDPGLFAEVDRIMESAVETGYTASAGSHDFRKQLRSNTEVFAAFKAHRMGRDMAAQLLDEDGEPKSFRQFKKDTKGIVTHHVDQWLRTEYDTAIKRAHKAAEMQQFRDEADVFPNIEWLPSTAVTPREEHKPFYHHIWPVNDPFWEQHKPGDEWGCQCDWAATDEPVTDNTGLIGEGGPSVSKGLGGDPASSGQIFSQDHPYFPSDCNHCSFYSPGVRDRLRTVFKARVKDCYNCPYIRSCINELDGKDNSRRNKELYRQLKEDKNYGHVKFDRASGGMSASHKEHNFDEVGGEYEKIAQKVGRKNGHAVIFESEYHTVDYHRFTEGTWDGLQCEIAGTETGTDNNILRGLEHCADKRATEVAILVFPNGGFTEEKMRRAISRYRGLAKLNDGEYVEFKRIVCIEGDAIVYDNPF